MKDRLKLLVILGLVSLLNLTIGCTGSTDMGDDTPPPEEDGYDGGGADKEQPPGEPGNIKSPDFDSKEKGKE